MTTIDYSELEQALDFVSFGTTESVCAYVSRNTRKIFWESPDLEELLPDDLEDPDLYVEVPSKLELNMGKPLAFKFASKHLSDCSRSVEEIFRKRGAYSRFKGLLESRNALEAWYEFENSSVKEALLEWAEAEGFSVKC